jgi:acyl-coenzyme A synthetase/AMP-(fatty) acid ligase
VILLNELVRKLGGQTGLFPDLRILVTGGSIITEELRHSTDQLLTKYLHVVYGTNELGFLTVAPPDDWRTYPGSIGRPIEGVEMEIVDAHGMPVTDGQPGLLRFRKQVMMSEYLNAPDLTRRSFRNGWFYPHDVGSMGADGVVRFIGRADDMMIFNGINVYPLEIERSMRELPGIKDVAALPLRHPVHQDVPVCAVVLQEGSVLDKAQILAWGRSALGAVSPKHVFILDQIPRDDSGKLLRPLLRKKISDVLDAAGSQIV